MRSIFKTFCGFAVPMLMCAPAGAGPLVAPRVMGTVVFTHPGTKTESFTFGTLGLSDPVWGNADLILAGTPLPRITAEAASGPDPAAQTVARAVGTLDYDFILVGPPGEVPVLVTIAGSAAGLASPGASFAVESSWSLASVTSLLASDSIASGQITGSFSDSFARIVSLVLTTNRVYTISMRADAAAGFVGGTSSTASAFIDPFLALGPGVDPSDYLFDFSAGIGNSLPPEATPVPEPATGVLLLSGIAATILRRRRALA